MQENLNKAKDQKIAKTSIDRIGEKWRVFNFPAWNWNSREKLLEKSSSYDSGDEYFSSLNQTAFSQTQIFFFFFTLFWATLGFLKSKVFTYALKNPKI